MDHKEYYSFWEAQKDLDEDVREEIRADVLEMEARRKQGKDDWQTGSIHLTDDMLDDLEDYYGAPVEELDEFVLLEIAEEYAGKGQADMEWGFDEINQFMTATYSAPYNEIKFTFTVA